MSEDVDMHTVASIYKLLPGKNCGGKSPCGLPKCALFAAKVLSGKKDVSECPYIVDENMQSILLVIDEYYR